jgi:ABC-type transport system involved in cytochrome c biogenesis permease subunit
MMKTVFDVTFVIYIVALLSSVITLLVKKRLADIVTSALLLLGVIAQTTYIGLRWYEANRAPFSNMFESLVLFGWTIVVIYLIVRIKIKVPWLGVATALMALVALAYASAFESDIEPLVPALQSNWLTFHVFTCFMGYGGFAVSFFASLGYLVGTRPGGAMTDDTRDTLELVVAKNISFGFLFLTIGIITGAVWANSAWGTYWSWDPKETWSLITWIIYAIFLHCRYVRGWRGKRAIMISVIGFLSVLFTYMGVNYLLSGLHSYAK